MKQYLCIDLGEKRIGLATGSLDTRLVRALGIIQHHSRKADFDRIITLINENQITSVIIGISYQEDGTPNSMGRHALSFGKDLETIIKLPVEYWDESLSTKDARADALSLGYSKKQRRGHQDALAAVVILQSFFDSQKTL
jgi:putative holliday junction resolvase